MTDSSHSSYGGSQYQGGYSHQSSPYLPHPSPAYPTTPGSAYHASQGYPHAPLVHGERPVHQTHVKGGHDHRCRDHTHGGECASAEGRKFSTSSNLSRHVKEKLGKTAKSECPQCGQIFTRKTARDTHLAGGKCKHIRGSSASGRNMELQLTKP